MPLPGEDLERQATERFAFRWFYVSGVTLGLLLATAAVWSARLFGTPWIAEILTVVTVFAVGWTVLTYRKVGAAIIPLLRGAHGERQVGAVLDELRSRGYFVFHQVPIPHIDGSIKTESEDSPAYAADHVIVGPAGVFVIETKRRGAVNSERITHVRYDGRQIKVNWRVQDKDPIAQVTRYAAGLGKHLRSSTGLGIFVRGVVLFPGAKVEECKGSGLDGRPWVLAPQRLQVWLNQELKRPDLAPGQIKPPLRHQQVERIKATVGGLYAASSTIRATGQSEMSRTP